MISKLFGSKGSRKTEQRGYKPLPKDWQRPTRFPPPAPRPASKQSDRRPSDSNRK